MDYMDTFKSHYRGVLSQSSTSALVRVDDNLSRLIDSDLTEGCMLLDEIQALHGLCRDECMHRLASSVRSGSDVESLGQ
ncbi:MAG: hypothetical protein LIO67_04075 [Lachnospiraceae bacterium]|nr:hypothetical protein [Lachnospiraceae bacterium]